MIEVSPRLAEAKIEAAAYSAEHPSEYIILTACFGLFITARKRLGTFAPSDSACDVYWLNGKEKPFTARQVIADQNATPTLS